MNNKNYEQQQHQHINHRLADSNHSPTHEITPSKKQKLEGGIEWREEGEGGISTLIRKWGEGENYRTKKKENSSNVNSKKQHLHSQRK